MNAFGLSPGQWGRPFIPLHRAVIGLVGSIELLHPVAEVRVELDELVEGIAIVDGAQASSVDWPAGDRVSAI